MDRGTCTKPEHKITKKHPKSVFQPETAAEVVEAQKLCVQCPVFKECYMWRQLSDSVWGVWAGQFYTPKKD